MKSTFYGIIFLISSPWLLHAQEIPDKEVDSINTVLLYINELNNKSEYGNAIALSKETLDYIEGSNKYELIGKAYNGLAFSYAELKDKDKAFEYSFKARDYFVKSKDTLSIVMIYNDIGVTYEDFNMIDEANLAFKQSLNFAEFTKPHRYHIYPSTNLGKNLIVYNKNYEKGLKYLYKAVYTSNALGLDEKTDHSYGEIYLSFGYAFHKLKRFEDSEIYFQKAIDLANTEKYLHSIEEIYSKRTKLYKEDENYKEALYMMDKYIEIKDSIIKLDNMSLTKDIEAKYKVKESEEKLSYLTKEKTIKEAQLSKSYNYNIALVLLSGLLLLTAYLITKRNRQLKQAKDIAEHLSSVKSDFYSEISHELRTPLYAVVELSSILLRENVDIKHQEYLESLKFSGNHLLALINNVLQLNKVESGKMRAEILNFDLKLLITNIIESLEYALRSSNNKIHLKYDDTIPNTIGGDSLKLSQVLINLISNAIKFTNNGNITVEMSLISNDNDLVRIHFNVVDDGAGIPEEKQSQVFEDFYQERSSKDQTHKGTGLGLSIVKRLVSVMGSNVLLKSEIDKGSSFSFSLDFNKIIASNKVSLELEEQLEKIKDCKFLIVDDNKINQLVTTKVLNNYNLKSAAVENGAKAIEQIKTENFDCILMDLHMPELDGYETTKLIRAFNKQITIIALTAASLEEVEDKVKNSEMDGFVLKPYFNKDLIATLSELVK
ncbi:ATP-binding protein [Lacinutrix sp.]|uniref:tetratricopeptide repeat-containing hybrid sensor histidine kinase/response regulator n=1 Tax=Lacinutrix sp. TaxID=1937692 RepID=UPI0025B96299|nr:ATP-binding protein [Lacinutrix sp.]